MAIEFGVWRIDGGFKRLEPSPMALEKRLEEVLAQDISVAAPNLMAIGRQVRTSFDKIVDLLAMDRAGNLAVLELKRDKTYRDIVAQVLDYGSWVRTLRDDDIARIFEEYQRKQLGRDKTVSINEAFCAHFHLSAMPDELNESHQLIIVAATLDPSTERIVNYLAESTGMDINVVFFQYVKDGEREYLCRAWLREPTGASSDDSEAVEKGDWNGEYYVSFGHDDKRDWEEARKYGFISGGGSAWYSGTLSMLDPGARVWVNVPGTGYVGVGKVIEPIVPVDDFMVPQSDGSQKPVVSLPLNMAKARRAADDPERAE